MEDEAEIAYKRVIEAIETAAIPPDPDAPSCNMWRLRPSEEVAHAMQRYLNPPPRWGLNLSLSSMFLGSEKCISIGRKLILNNTVTTIDISMCDMQDKGAVEFFSCLKRNKCLKHLNVDGNYIGDKGAIAAAKCIQNLETLHMSCNDIHDEGAIAIASSLRISSKIKTINLRANRITFYGAYKLIDALEPILPRISLELAEKISARESSRVTEGDEVTSLSIKSYPAGLLEGSGDIDNDITPEGMVESKENNKDFPIEVYNETLHTLWLRENVDIPEDFFKLLDTILVKRFPQPPKGVSKKTKKRGKETSKEKGK
ncbi:Leucine-rich repeat [Trypanosoma melophagium]|uniref:Leucine-rich repeat n=1 Tax=Trypanosoma melophagium TaxID=715481 RepID=UPI00351A1077|nr:Leucine-rich repeat [Trypanosoma melophagium]